MINKGNFIMKKIFCVLLSTLFATGCLCGCGNNSAVSENNKKNTSSVLNTENNSAENKDSIYQVALLQSLVQGNYDGVVTVKELKKHGDFGIGTFEGVNGEMIFLDGVMYQAVSDGSIKLASDDTTVPFADVTYFENDIKSELSDIKSFNDMTDMLDKLVEKNGKNNFYAVKLTGTFSKIQVRSEYPQKKPYKPLAKVMETDQTIFDFESVKGTAVGLYCPDYMSGLNTSGWHLHFITEDKKNGGHILKLSADKLTAEMDLTGEFKFVVPNEKSFQDMSLADNVNKDIEKVEKND